jgi:hypothetical protein
MKKVERVGMLRVVEDQSVPIPEEMTSELGRIKRIEDGLSMRGVKEDLVTSLAEDGGSRVV